MSVQHELLIGLLRNVNKEIGRRVKDVLEDQDMPVAMVTIAKAVNEEPGITISEIARRTGIAKSHVSNTIKELEKRGWVEKRNDQGDQRLIRLFLTPMGLGNIHKVGLEIRKMLRELVADVPEQRTMGLIDALQEINNLLGSERRVLNQDIGGDADD